MSMRDQSDKIDIKFICGVVSEIFFFNPTYRIHRLFKYVWILKKVYSLTTNAK